MGSRSWSGKEGGWSLLGQNGDKHTSSHSLDSPFRFWFLWSILSPTWISTGRSECTPWLPNRGTNWGYCRRLLFPVSQYCYRTIWLQSYIWGHWQDHGWGVQLPYRDSVILLCITGGDDGPSSGQNGFCGW